MNEIEKQIEIPFTVEEIEDVRIIVKAKGKHYAIMPRGDKEEARMLRIVLLSTMLDDYYIVNASLEEIKK